MNKVNTEKDIWSSMRENRTRRERVARHFTPLFRIVTPFVCGGILWSFFAQAPCTLGSQKIVHIGWQNYQLIQFSPVKTDTSEALLSCTASNSFVMYNAILDTLQFIQSHLTEIAICGTFIIFFCAGVYLFLWLIRSIFS